MENAKKFLPFILIGVAAALIAVAFLLAPRGDETPSGPSIGELLDVDPPSSTPPPDDTLDTAASGNPVSPSDSGGPTLINGRFNWYEVIDNFQWRFTYEDGVEWAIVFDEDAGLGYFKTQTLPPETSGSRTGAWRVECPESISTQERSCLGRPGESVTLRLNQGTAEQNYELLHVTYIDADTLEGRFDHMPEDQKILLRKKIWE